MAEDRNVSARGSKRGKWNRRIAITTSVIVCCVAAPTAAPMATAATTVNFFWMEWSGSDVRSHVGAAVTDSDGPPVLNSYLDGVEGLFALSDDVAVGVGFRPPTGQTLTVGSYPLVASLPDATNGSVSVLNGETTCSAVDGEFEIIDISGLSTLMASFAVECSAGGTATGFIAIGIDDSIVGDLTGRIRRDGVTLSGADIELLAIGANTADAIDGSDSVGNYSFSNVTIGVYDIRISANGSAPQWNGGHLARALGERVAVLPGSRTQPLAIEAGGGIWGTVTNEGFAPIDNSTEVIPFTVDGDALDATRVVEVQGSLWFERFLAPGTYRLKANSTYPEVGVGWHPSATSFQRASDISVTRTTSARADVTLADIGYLEVEILTADGLAPRYGYAEVWSEDNLDFRQLEYFPDTVTKQTFELARGWHYVLGASYERASDILWHYFPEWYPNAPVYSEGARPVRVEPGETTRITIVLTPFYPDMFDSTFSDDIYWMHGAGITTGCGAAGFCPEDTVTRGQMAAFLVRALGLTDSDPDIDFSDDDDSVFQADIEKLATAGITSGCTSDRFCPDDPVTRGQMAAFLVRALGYTDQGTTDFTDDNGSVFESDIEKLAAAGVTTGCGSTTFCPNDHVTRGQMAAFLHRALGGGVLYPGQAEQAPIAGVLGARPNQPEPSR